MSAGQEAADAKEKRITLPVIATSGHVVQDYATTSLPLKAHPVSFVRDTLDQLHIIPIHQLSKLKDGVLVKVAKLVLEQQRESALWQLKMKPDLPMVIFENLFLKFRKEILQPRFIMV